MSESSAGKDRWEGAFSSLTPIQMGLVAVFVGMQVVPRLLLTSSIQVLSPVDRDLGWALAGAGVILSQSVWWGLWGTSAWRKGRMPAKITMAILSAAFSALYAVLLSLPAATIFGLYELRYRPSDSRQMLYAVELVSDAGRGGPRAYVDPYGFGRRSLPLGQADFHAFTSGRFTWQGLVCYRVTELRRGDVIGVVVPSQHATPDGALTRCDRPDPRVVVYDTPRPGGTLRNGRQRP